MNNTKQTRFNYIGNLAFYDGWKPDYIYFKSLLAAGENYSDSENNRWRTDLALPIANRAIADATARSHLNELSEEEASSAMLERFNNICTFLQQAITYERNNEVRYFKQKYEQLKNTFTPEEQKTIPQLAELLNMFNPDTNQEFDYTKFTTLINVLQHGLDQTKTIVDYEQQHLSKIDKAIQGVVTARDKQITGLGTKQKKSLKEIQEMVEKSHRTIEVQDNQKVIDTGLYGIVRHPMYAVTFFLFLTMPLILGSIHSFVIFLIYPVIIGKRIRNEEILLEKDLKGYTEYKKKVKYKVIPFVW